MSIVWVIAAAMAGGLGVWSCGRADLAFRAQGGGKADSAQGQVPDASKLDDVIAAAQQFAESKL